MALLRIGFKYPGSEHPPLRGSREEVKREYDAIARSLALWKESLGTVVHEVRIGQDRVTIWLDELTYYSFEDSKPLRWFDYFLGKIDDEKA